MCLYIKKRSRYLVSSKNIPCYKIVEVLKDNENPSEFYWMKGTDYMSMFQKMFYRKNTEYRFLHPTFLLRFISYSATFNGFESQINEGYHSYMTKKTAINELRQYNKDRNYSFESCYSTELSIIKCYIPAGVGYYRGVDSNSYMHQNRKNLKTRTKSNAFVSEKIYIGEQICV